MELFTKLFGSLLVFVYHCFDRIVIHAYLSGLSRPESSHETAGNAVALRGHATVITPPDHCPSV